MQTDENGSFVQCEDVDECAAESDPCTVGGNPASCANNVGGFTCTCDTGFTGGLGINEINSCVDINECNNSSTCQIDTGNPASCSNTVGSFNCTCNSGITADSNGFCSDDNECLEDPCGIGGLMILSI